MHTKAPAQLSISHSAPSLPHPQTHTLPQTHTPQTPDPTPPPHHPPRAPLPLLPTLPSARSAPHPLSPNSLSFYPSLHTLPPHWLPLHLTTAACGSELDQLSASVTGPRRSSALRYAPSSCEMSAALTLSSCTSLHATSTPYEQHIPCAHRALRTRA